MRHIPNILSVFRIALIPFFVQQMTLGNTYAAGLILVVSGLTDLLDGKLARRFGWVSQAGKLLDPIADKLTQAAVSITLMAHLRHYWVFFAIMIAKDLVMLVLGGMLLGKGVKLDGAKWFGKVSTCVYYGAMIAIVFIPTMPVWLTTALLTTATGCALIAACMYIPEYVKYRKMTVSNGKQRVRAA